ncbi:MAG: hypothetical protein NZ526_05825 [Aquificaceae bacterium]|nr:hypothetical protein [Aquificaceae bacterium]
MLESTRSLTRVWTGERVRYERMKRVVICWSEIFGFLLALGFGCVRL